MHPWHVYGGMHPLTNALQHCGMLHTISPGQPKQRSLRTLSHPPPHDQLVLHLQQHLHPRRAWPCGGPGALPAGRRGQALALLAAGIVLGLTCTTSRASIQGEGRREGGSAEAMKQCSEAACKRSGDVCMQRPPMYACSVKVLCGRVPAGGV